MYSTSSLILTLQDTSCDQNANTSQMLSSGHTPHIQLFPDHQWDGA